MLDQCEELAKESKSCAYFLEVLDEPLSQCLENAATLEKLSARLPEIAKHVSKQIALDLIELVDGPWIDEIEDTYKIEGFNAWYKETHGITVEEAREN